MALTLELKATAGRKRHDLSARPTLALRLSEWLACYAGDQWELLWVTNGLDRQIYVELGPVQVLRRRLLDLKYFADRCVLEPGELLERKE
jgi:hypothetical protein